MRRRTGLLCSILTLGVLAGDPAWAAPTAGDDDVEVELVGFLVYLPEPGGREGGGGTPSPGVTAARLEVPNQQGGARVVFSVEFTARTEVALPGGRARPGEVVVLDGALHRGRIRALRVREVRIVELAGRLSLPDGPLVLPVVADRIVDVALDGAPTLGVAFLLTPWTASRWKSIRDGQPVILAVAHGTRIVVGLEGRAPSR